MQGVAAARAALATTERTLRMLEMVDREWSGLPKAAPTTAEAVVEDLIRQMKTRTESAASAVVATEPSETQTAATGQQTLAAAAAAPAPPCRAQAARES